MSDSSFRPLGCAVLTVSDTRTVETDTSGRLAAERLRDAGHEVHERVIVPDDGEKIRAQVAAWLSRQEIVIVIVTGGTGITLRDVTPEALEPLVTKHIVGFGELFRALSYEDIGPATLQSRSFAALCDKTLVFALPGSSGAVALAMDRIILPQLDLRTKPCNFAMLLDRL
jgi:molybdenum cofactor biosynthesis protein B